jgi:hypothetical protein
VAAVLATVAIMLLINLNDSGRSLTVVRDEAAMRPLAPFLAAFPTDLPPDTVIVREGGRVDVYRIPEDCARIDPALREQFANGPLRLLPNSETTLLGACDAEPD